MIDLRWGIRDQSHDDHTIIDFCLREIDNCKKTSLGGSTLLLVLFYITLLKLKVKVVVYVRFAAMQQHQALQQIFHGPELIFPTSWEFEPGTSEWFSKSLSARPWRCSALRHTMVSVKYTIVSFR